MAVLAQALGRSLAASSALLLGQESVFPAPPCSWSRVGWGALGGGGASFNGALYVVEGGAAEAYRYWPRKASWRAVTARRP